MRELNLKPYMISVNGPKGMTEIPYDVKGSLGNIVLSPNLKLNGRDLLKSNKVISKIEDCKEDAILLEESEFKYLTTAFERFEGFSKNEVELVKRVLESEIVKVDKVDNDGK